MNGKDKVKITVEMDVTIPQALALQAMFNRWNQLSSMGSSRVVGFFVDGDGNFHPNAKIMVDKEIPELTSEMIKSSWIQLEGCSQGDGFFDFDRIAWLMHKQETENDN